MSSIIEFQNVSFSYKNQSGASASLYNGLSFQIERGTMTTIIGSSGSGKSTLLNLMAGFLRPQKGTVTVEGKVVSQMTPDEACHYRNETIGFIYQAFNLLPEITAQQNVMLPLMIAKKTDPMKKSEEVMRSLGIAEKADSLPTKMSGGEQQRTAIARAIVNDAPIILADEPTGNLDQENADAVKRILKDLTGRGKTVVVVSHDLTFSEISDHVINVNELK